MLILQNPQPDGGATTAVHCGMLSLPALAATRIGGKCLAFSAPGFGPFEPDGRQQSHASPVQPGSASSRQHMMAVTALASVVLYIACMSWAANTISDTCALCQAFA
jgi:hypothetical protein